MRGAGRVAGEIPHERSPAVEESTPPDPAAPAPWPGMRTWMPIVDEAARSLAERRIVLDINSLAGKARQQAFSVASLNTEEAIGKVRDALVEAVEAGHDLQTFGEKVGEAIGTSALGVGSLENVYRTGMAQAFAAGQEAVHENPQTRDLWPYVLSMPVRDSRLTDLCAIISRSGLNGTGVFRVDDPVWLKFKNPRHFNCFLPGTQVEGRFLVGLKAFYSGEVVEMTTRSGNRLTVTVNHPILTERGFVAAGEINKGDNLLRYAGGVKEGSDLSGWDGPTAAAKAGLSVPAKHKQNTPASIEEVFASLADFFDGPARRTPTTPDDFHGDAASGNGHVEVVGAYRELGIDVDTETADSGGDFGFVTVDSGSVQVVRSRVSSLDIVGLRPTATRGMSDSEPLSSGCSIHARPLNPFRIGLAAEIDASRYEVTSDYRSVNSFLLTQREDGIAASVSTGQGSEAQEDSGGRFGYEPVGLQLASELDTGATENASHTASADANFLAQLFNRYPTLVAFDDVVEIRKYEWSGHVYDLQAEGGWIVANGVFSSNCRCGRRYLTVSQAADQGVREAQEWLRSGTPPATPEYVPEPNVELPKGWVGNGDGFQLSFCNTCAIAERVLLSMGEHDEEFPILLSWVPFTTKTGKPAAYWDANPKRKLYGKAYAAWAAKQGQAGAQGQQPAGAKPKAAGAEPAGAEPAGAKPKEPEATSAAQNNPAPASAASAGGQPDNPASPQLKQPAAQVSAELAKIRQQAQADLADAGHPVNRLAKEMREVAIGNGLKIKTLTGASLDENDHRMMGRFHQRLSKVLAINGNQELARAQSIAADNHFAAAKKKTEETDSRIATLHGLVDQSLAEATLTEHARRNYGESFKRVMGRMSPKAIERLHAGLKGMTFHADFKGVTETAAARGLQKYAENIKKGKYAAGLYFNDTGKVALNGGNPNRRGDKLRATDKHLSRDHTYAHELTHALDGGHFGTKISASKEWQHAWRDEIVGADQISDYAKHNPSEGFAEFGRLVFTQGKSAAEIRKAFPRSAAIWDKHGLLHDPPQETARPGAPKKMPNVFSKPISDDTMTGDLALPQRAWNKVQKLLHALHA